MAAESFAILIVEPGRAKLSRFNVELRGETLWAADTEELVRRLGEFRPELVAAAGDAQAAADLADDLRRRGVARSVFVITPAADEESAAPGQVTLVLPGGPAALEPEGLLRRLVQAVLSVQARAPVSALTGLPGSPVLRQDVERRLTAAEPFIFLYLDLDNFKAYNDVYGFGRGDIAIRLLGREVMEATEAHGTSTDLCVHIGGDDFAIVTTSEAYPDLAGEIISGFDHQVPRLYSEDDRARGFIQTRSRRGELTRYPLMTVSIGGVNTARRRVSGYLYLTEIAAEVKSFAKAVEGSQFVMDRRAD
jgi:GGDEF domain-containing protein